MASILFVDDDLVILQLFSAVFQNSGYQIFTARSGDAALKLLETETPALIVLDIAMPMMTGEDVLNKIRANDRFKETHILILTAAPTRITTEIEGRVDRVVLKPITPKALREVIFSILAPC
jgi:two-component system alkaline phosphatase synthesis response regulator PhoP